GNNVDLTVLITANHVGMYDLPRLRSPRSNGGRSPQSEQFRTKLRQYSRKSGNETNSRSRTKDLTPPLKAGAAIDAVEPKASRRGRRTAEFPLRNATQRIREISVTGDMLYTHAQAQLANQFTAPACAHATPVPPGGSTRLDDASAAPERLPWQ
ncbi:hypothetical protein FOL47_002025, partial [Perkinsus chesapeaki]